jgi:hypothetical protein
MATEIRQIKVRRDTTVSWTTGNPTLAAGEWGLDTDTKQMKIGDGVTAWNSLPGGPRFASSILDTPTINAPTFGAGSATAASKPKLTSGTNLTTPEAGALEYDGSVFYQTPNTTFGRGLAPIHALIRQDTTYTLTSNTSVQKLFGASANGRINLPLGTYRFNCLYYLTAMSATSGNSSFSLVASGATIQSNLQMAIGTDSAAATVGALSGIGITSAAFPASQHTAGTGVTQSSFITGTFEITVAGFVIPSVQLVTASAAVVQIGSFFEVWQISGATNLTTIGAWS